MDRERSATDQVLVALRGGASRPSELRRPSAKAAREAAIESLVARGAVEKHRKGGGWLLLLTASGAEEAARLGDSPLSETTPARARATRASSSQATISPSEIAAEVTARVILELRPLVERIESRLARIESRLEAREAIASTTPSVARVDGLKPAILSTIARLDAQFRYGGVVPIPALREALRRAGVAAPHAEVDAALVALERDYKIDRLVAQSPATLSDPGQGIERPGRGLAYFVAPRPAAS